MILFEPLDSHFLLPSRIKYLSSTGTHALEPFVKFLKESSENAESLETRKIWTMMIEKILLQLLTLLEQFFDHQKQPTKIYNKSESPRLRQPPGHPNKPTSSTSDQQTKTTLMAIQQQKTYLISTRKDFDKILASETKDSSNVSFNAAGSLTLWKAVPVSVSRSVQTHEVDTGGTPKNIKNVWKATQTSDSKRLREIETVAYLALSVQSRQANISWNRKQPPASVMTADTNSCLGSNDTNDDSSMLSMLGLGKNASKDTKLGPVPKFMSKPHTQTPAKKALDESALSEESTAAPSIRSEIRVGFLFSFDLKANPKMILHQLRHASVLSAGGQHFLMMYSDYYAKPDGKFKAHTIDGKEYVADPTSKKSLLVAAKINDDCKGAMITYGFSLDTPGEQLLDVQSLCLTDTQNPKSPKALACYLACMTYVPPQRNKQVALQLYNSTSKKSRILLTSTAPISHTKSYFQLVELNDGKDFLVLFQKSKNQLKLVLAPQNNSLFHSYFASSPVVDTPGDPIETELMDFAVDSELDTQNLTTTVPGDATWPTPYTTQGFSLVTLSELSSISEAGHGQVMGHQIALIRSLRFEDDKSAGTEQQYLQKICWEPTEFEIHKCSEVFDMQEVMQQIQEMIPTPSNLSLKPAKVRFCSTLNRVFVFGTAEASDISKPEAACKKFVFLAMFRPKDSEGERIETKILILPRLITSLTFNMNEIQLKNDGRHGKLMPPVEPRFMIAENPALRSGQRNSEDPIFIFGVENDDVLFGCWLKGKDTMEVKDAKSFLLRNGSTAKKDYHHVTSISWTSEQYTIRETMLKDGKRASAPQNSSKFTIASNRYSVMNLNLYSTPA